MAHRETQRRRDRVHEARGYVGTGKSKLVIRTEIGLRKTGDPKGKRSRKSRNPCEGTR